MTPLTAAHQASLSFTISQSLLRLMSTESVMPSNHLIPVILCSSCPQSFQESGSFPVSQLFASGSQSTGASVSTSVLPVNIQSGFPLRLTGLISLLSKVLSKVFFPDSYKRCTFFPQPDLQGYKLSTHFAFPFVYCSIRSFP